MAEEIIKLTARDDTRGAFASLQRSIEATQSSAGRLAQLIPAIGAAFSATQFVGFVRGSINAADALNDLSERTGVAVERLSAFQYAAKLSDVSNESLAAGLRGLARSIAEGDKGFAQLGVSVRDIGGNLRASDQVLLDVAERFSQLEDGPGKAALAMQLFGKSGADLIPLLNAGKVGLQQFADEAARLGVVVSQDTARAAAQFNDNLDRLKAGLEGFGLGIANTVLPSLNRFVEELVESQRIFGSFTSALLNVGVAIDPFKSLTDNLKIYRRELDELEAARKRYQASNADTSAIDQSIATARKRLEFLKFQERARIQAGGADTLDARDLAMRAGAPAKGRLAAPVDEQAQAAAKRAAQDRLQAEIRAAQETGRIVAATAADRAAVRAAEFQVEQEALKRQQEAAKDAEEAQKRWKASVEGLLAQTQIGRVAGIQQQMADLAEFGRLNPDRDGEVTQAFEQLNVELQKAKGMSTATFGEIAKDGSKAFRDLEFAVQGWGRQFTDTLADAVMTGKLNFQDLANSIVRDLLRMQIQASITKPLFEAFGAGFGSLFKSANGNAFGPAGVIPFAKGGVVGGPTLFGFGGGSLGLMGEAGPEAVMPLRRGRDGRLGVESAGGGRNVMININVDSRSDRAAVRAEVRAAVEQALAQDRDERRRGRG